MHGEKTIYLATRGSALALAQARQVLDRCRAVFPDRTFEIKIIRTTGDKLQTASLAKEATASAKGLFTKELESALLNGEADLAVHSLKDLPTDLPDGLVLGAVGPRVDVRDVLIYRRGQLGGGASSGAARCLPPGTRLATLPAEATVATSSVRRREQILAACPRANVVEIRGNVGTRLRKLAEQPSLDATVLAAAGLGRLRIEVGEDGGLRGEDVPEGLAATILGLEEMLPCVGQGAVGIEVRREGGDTAELCRKLNHGPTFQCVTAERSFLRAMGGGCQSPVGAYGDLEDGCVRMRVVVFQNGTTRRAQGQRAIGEAEALGLDLAQQIKTG